MRRVLTGALAALAVLAAGCGGTHHATAPRAPARPACSPPAGGGVMGACTPQLASIGPPASATGFVTFPDLSEFQGCPQLQHGTPGIVIRLYEAGLGREDLDASCDARRAHAARIPFAGYAFLRPGSCVREASATVAIARAIGVTGAIIADAEVPLPAGFVSCFVHQVEHDGWPAVTYSAPGTWPGGRIETSLWVATYGSQPGCVAGVCHHVAWQFTDRGWCHGIFGDCSIDSGLLAIRHAQPRPPVPNRRRAKLERRIAELRVDLQRHHCRVVHGRHAYPLCARWAREGRAAHRRLQQFG